jgi:hypothetical protein
MDSELVGPITGGQTRERRIFVPLKRKDGGTELCRRLRRRDAYTTETRMEHMVNGKQK